MSTEASQVSGLSGRYAVALFELAKEKGVLDTVASDLEAIQAMLDQSADLRGVLRNPLLARDVQVAAVSAVLQKAGVSKDVLNFVCTVGVNRRLGALSLMIRDYQVLLAAHRGQVLVQVVSAAEVADAELTALRDALSGKVGQQVKIDSHVDSSLIGGVVVRLGSRMYDGSVKTKLQSLKLAMKGVG